jgi:hypothetical protein
MFPHLASSKVRISRVFENQEDAEPKADTVRLL